MNTVRSYGLGMGDETNAIVVKGRREEAKIREEEKVKKDLRETLWRSYVSLFPYSLDFLLGVGFDMNYERTTSYLKVPATLAATKFYEAEYSFCSCLKTHIVCVCNSIAPYVLSIVS